MRVAIDLSALQLDQGGTARAIVHLLEQLEGDPRVELLELRHDGPSGSGRLATILRGLQRELWYMPVKLPRAARAGGAEVLHCPSPLVPARPGMPLVVTVHDAIGWDHPEWLTRANVLQLTRVLPRAISHGAIVVTSSNYSRERIAEVLKLPMERIHVAPLGIDQRFSPESGPSDERLRSALGVDGRYVLTVGTLQPRKNVEAAIAAFELLPQDSDLKLAIVGARGWHDDELLDRIAGSPAAGSVQALGKVTDDELLALYRGASCFVFPSRYEGFGFPPLEAMACGVPVLSTTNTSLAEAVGEAGVELDPDDPAQIAAELERVLGSEALREDLRARGFAHAAKFTWQRTADLTIAAYEHALAGG